MAIAAPFLPRFEASMQISVRDPEWPAVYMRKSAQATALVPLSLLLHWPWVLAAKPQQSRWPRGIYTVCLVAPWEINCDIRDLGRGWHRRPKAIRRGANPLETASAVGHKHKVRPWHRMRCWNGGSLLLWKPLLTDRLDIIRQGLRLYRGLMSRGMCGVTRSDGGAKP